MNEFLPMLILIKSSMMMMTMQDKAINGCGKGRGEKKRK